MNVKNDLSDNALTNPANEFFTPMTIRSIFWLPRFHVNSPILPYAPFLFWLTDIWQPRRVAVIGADDGFVHFLFCQTIDKSGSYGKVYGFGFWKDENSDTKLPTIPEKLSEHAYSFYEELSDLSVYRTPLSESEKIAENSLDLVFVDLNTFSEDTPIHVKDWHDLIHENGFLIIHGTNNLGSHPRLNMSMNKRLNQNRRIVFFDGDGLIVYAIGKKIPARLESLMSACENNEIPPEIAVIFRRLGHNLKVDAEVKDLKEQKKNSQTTLVNAKNYLKKN